MYFLRPITKAFKLKSEYLHVWLCSVQNQNVKFASEKTVKCTPCTCILKYRYSMSMQCLNNNLNICIQTRPFTAIADATVYVWLYCTLHICIYPINQTYIVASTLAVTGLVCMRRFRLFSGQCIFLDICMLTPYNTHTVCIHIAVV